MGVCMHTLADIGMCGAMHVALPRWEEVGLSVK